MAFKMRSGNQPAFKNIGSSPMKQGWWSKLKNVGSKIHEKVIGKQMTRPWGKEENRIARERLLIKRAEGGQNLSEFDKQSLGELGYEAGEGGKWNKPSAEVVEERLSSQSPKSTEESEILASKSDKPGIGVLSREAIEGGGLSDVAEKIKEKVEETTPLTKKKKKKRYGI